MDALVKLLMQQYKIPQAQAQQYAADIHSRAGVDKSKIDSAEADSLKQEDGLQTEAYVPAANEEISRLDSLGQKFKIFTDLAKKRAAGEKLEPGLEQWYQEVRGKHDANIRAAAQASTDKNPNDPNLIEDFVAGGQGPRPTNPRSMRQMTSNLSQGAVNGANAGQAPQPLDFGPARVQSTQDVRAQMLMQAARGAVGNAGNGATPQSLDFGDAQVSTLPNQAMGAEQIAQMLRQQRGF